jgi:cytochrome P450
MIVRPGVSFDYADPSIQGQGYWDALRDLRAHGPLVWVETNGGFWAATSHDVVLAIAQDWSTFSSAEGVAIPRPGPDVIPYIVPLETDPPRQRTYRQRVNPYLTVRAMSVHEQPIRAIADELIDQFIGRGSCDLVADFSRKFPGTVFFRLIIRCDDAEFRVAEPVARDISFETPGTERWTNAVNGLRQWASRMLEEKAGTGDDIVNAVRHLNDGGGTFADHEISSGLQVLVQGGIGTSASAISSTMLALSRDRRLQDDVRRDPTLVPRLIEECLRLEAPVPLMFRTATRDVELAGQTIHQGDKVGLFFGAANRDPAVFDRPDELDLDRPHYRHLTFGAGAHRCVGSNLARLQIRVAIEALVSRMSQFRLADGAEIPYASLQARGPLAMPLEFVAAPNAPASGAALAQQ